MEGCVLTKARLEGSRTARSLVDQANCGGNDDAIVRLLKERNPNKNLDAVPWGLVNSWCSSSKAVTSVPHTPSSIPLMNRPDDPPA